MFKRILLPTDGSGASAAAADITVELARRTGASLVGLHVTPARPLFSAVLGVLAAPEYEAQAKKYLEYIEQRAAHAHVPVTSIVKTADEPFEAIIQAARDLQCDLIAMGPHGRKGAEALLLGSQTRRVLTHSAIPVLVIR